MPISVPTSDEFKALDDEVGQLSLSLAALDARVTGVEQSLVDAIASVTVELNALNARVTALEAEVGVPPDPVDPPDPEPEPPLPGSMQVVLTINGKQLTYDEATATGLGDYFDSDHRFVMSCSRATHPELPGFRVDFRSTDAWRCVVFEFSDPLFSGLPNLAYSVTVEGETIDIPDHYANASWRWQSCPWPHPLTPLATLYQRKLLPRHDPALACGKAGNLTNVHSAPPMSLCGLTPEMGMTGGRADIGVVTGWQAEWICLQGADMLRTVIVQGEAAFPWRFRDPDTGAILDAIKQYPQASMHWGNGPSGSPQVYHGTGPHPGLDSAHSPSCYYVPFLLTGDPYFLEMHQGELMYHFMEIPRNSTTVVGSEQVRGVAWSLRTLLNAALATPDEVPSWILPKQIFVDELERQRGLLEARQSDGYPYRSFAHNIDSYGRWQHAWWQHDYATAVIAWISMHYPQWAQQRDWMVEGVDGRSDPASGWCPGYPTSYWTNTTNKNDWYPEGSFKTWAEAWEWNAAYVYTDLVNGACPTLEEMLSRNTTYDYFSAMMHALRLASQAGSEPAKPVLQRLTAAWETGLREYGFTEYKYCAAAE